MKSRLLHVMAPATALAAILHLAGCGGGDDSVSPEPVPPTVLAVVVDGGADTTLVEGANVVLYRAETREAVLRDMTGPEGVARFECEAGNYYVEVSAQGYEPVPPENIAPVPFFVAAEETTSRAVSLHPLAVAGGAGYILGHVQPAASNFLVLAESQSGQQKSCTVSGPDGFFVLYNLPYGTWSLEALKAGYLMTGDVDASISPEAEVDTVQIQVASYEGSLLTGQVTFLASENSTVDITLLDPATRAVVPGLATMSGTTSLDYAIAAIPDGDYLAWASLKNDGYVIDPDWVFKNPGGLDVSFAGPDTVRLNFSVTDAITILSPTNPADSTFAVMADSTVPTFRWTAYPSAKEYIIEVRDLDGRVLWGGFEPDGTVDHAFIGAGVTSVRYDFDGQSGIPALEPGRIYQWKLWADQGTQYPGRVEQLISSSEDLLGLFQVPGGPAE